MKFKVGEHDYLYKDTVLQIITINVSTIQLKMIGKLINDGVFASRSEALRMMLSEWLPQKIQEMKDIKDYIGKEIEEEEEEEEEGKVRIPNGDGTETQYHVVRRLE
jgi:Arc/MetJ-type ribon-helix-helix transcriptional regulator